MMCVLKHKHQDAKKTSYKNVMKSMKIYIPMILVGTLLFIWSIRENFEDTAQVHGPPYGRTAIAAQRLIDIMTPELLKSIKIKMGVSSTSLTDAEKIKLVYGDSTNNSPISKTMSNFYWQVYRPATSTISIAQVNKFLDNQDDTWVDANMADMREFLTRYFIRGQNGAAQSGYGDVMNSPARGAVISQSSVEKPKVDVKETPDTWASQRLFTIAAISLAAFSILAALIVFFLPSRV
jgi:hypothetical protein